jgi:hypothetical protein
LWQKGQGGKLQLAFLEDLLEEMKDHEAEKVQKADNKRSKEEIW